jgi:ABC-2 type transport system permease protein
MRWLLLKDIQILRRSPFLLALLVIYPVAIAVLIGFALSRGPEKPRVAFLNEVPQKAKFKIGGTSFDIADARSELYDRLEVVPVKTRGEARRKVRDGDVLGALILPRDLVTRLEAGGLEQPTVDVYVNQEDPVKARLVDSQISALLTEANLRLSRTFSRVTLDYLKLLLTGGKFSIFGRSFDVLGLEKSEKVMRAAVAGLPKRSGLRPALEQVIGFSRLARQNLDLSDNLLATVSQPIKVRKSVISGSAPSLTTFAVSVSASITLMFVTVLLVAGSLALEREENTYARLTRGLVGRGSLLASKLALGAAAALAVTLLMLVILALFVSLDWGRFPLWPPAILAGGAGFAAMGAAIGGLAREVRTASLLAFMLSLPIVFLSLVPSGTVAPSLYDVIRVVAALFPFKPTLDLMAGALQASGPAVGWPLVHLAGLTLAYGAVARLALRRFV